MKLRDTVFKRLGRDIWMYHTTSPYKVRINSETLVHLSSLVKRQDARDMTAQEEFLYKKLKARDMISDRGDDSQTEVPAVKEKSSLDAIELELSSACNLECKHCFAILSKKMMNSKILRKVFEGVSDLDVITILFSGGEPLLNPLFPEACRKARELDLKIIVMTNATCITEELAQMLAQNRVAKVVVSLDSFKEYHDVIRSQGSFDKAVLGIRTMTRNQLPVFVTTMAHDRNIQSLESFKKFCLGELKVSGVRYSAVVPIARAASPPSLNEFSISPANLKEIYTVGFIDEEEAALPVSASLPQNTFSCRAGIGQMFVAADGQVYPCHYFQNLDESIGTLKDDSFSNIYWRNFKSGPTSSFDWDTMTTCRTCTHFGKCRGGCRARAKLLAGSLSDPDPFACRIYQALDSTATG